MKNSFTHSLSSTLEHSSAFSGSSSNLSPNPITSRAVEDFSPLRTNSYSYAMTTEEVRFLTYQMWPLTFLSPSELVRAGFYYILEKEMATHSSVLAWRIPGTGEPDGLLSTGSHKVRHDWSDLAVAAAAAGFYYIGPGDRVACFAYLFRGEMLNNWKPKDDVMLEHWRLFPNCPFLEILWKCRGSAFKIWACRHMQLDWEHLRAGHRLYQFSLASAGFYHVGRNDDVEYFCYDGGLRCWKSGDNPWVEHSKCFPRYEFLICMKEQWWDSN